MTTGFLYGRPAGTGDPRIEAQRDMDVERYLAQVPVLLRRATHDPVTPLDVAVTTASGRVELASELRVVIVVPRSGKVEMKFSGYGETQGLLMVSVIDVDTSAVVKRQRVLRSSGVTVTTGGRVQYHAFTENLNPGDELTWSIAIDHVNISGDAAEQSGVGMGDTRGPAVFEVYGA